MDSETRGSLRGNGLNGAVGIGALLGLAAMIRRIDREHVSAIEVIDVVTKMRRWPLPQKSVRASRIPSECFAGCPAWQCLPCRRSP